MSHANMVHPLTGSAALTREARWALPGVTPGSLFTVSLWSHLTRGGPCAHGSSSRLVLQHPRVEGADPGTILAKCSGHCPAPYLGKQFTVPLWSHVTRGVPCAQGLPMIGCAAPTGGECTRYTRYTRYALEQGVKLKVSSMHTGLYRALHFGQQPTLRFCRHQRRGGSCAQGVSTLCVQHRQGEGVCQCNRRDRHSGNFQTGCLS